MSLVRKACVCLGIALLALHVSSCDNGLGPNQPGTDLKEAVAYPAETIDTSITNDEVKTFTNKEDYGNYLLSIFGNDENKWPVELFNNHIDICTAIETYNPVKITATTYQKVKDVVFFEYCNWYEPNSTLSIALSSVNEVSVSESITKSVGANVGYDSTSISGSISKETSVTVSTANGIEVSTSYDLTKYKQDKLYKVLLMGDYTCIKYKVEAIFSSTPHVYNVEGIKVNQDSLKVVLVHK